MRPAWLQFSQAQKPSSPKCRTGEPSASLIGPPVLGNGYGSPNRLLRSLPGSSRPALLRRWCRYGLGRRIDIRLLRPPGFLSRLCRLPGRYQNPLLHRCILDLPRPSRLALGGLGRLHRSTRGSHRQNRVRRIRLRRRCRFRGARRCALVFDFPRPARTPFHRLSHRDNQRLI